MQLERDLPVGVSLPEQEQDVALAWREQRLALGRAAGRATPAASSCMPREARWIVLRTSRAWVFHDRQALAPKASSWDRSAEATSSANRTRVRLGVPDAELADLGQVAQGAGVGDQHVRALACSVCASWS